MSLIFTKPAQRTQKRSITPTDAGDKLFPVFHVSLARNRRGPAKDTHVTLINQTMSGGILNDILVVHKKV